MRNSKRMAVCATALILITGMMGGCAKKPMQFDSQVTAPQLIVNPSEIRTGVATLMKNKIVFQGKGFDPGDSVFVSVMEVPRDGETINVPIAEAMVEEDGSFTAEVVDMVKITELLRADVGLNEEMETYLIVSKPPITPGSYTARAMSMESDKTADCPFTIKDASFGDGIKDWIGGLLGKIEKK